MLKAVALYEFCGRNKNELTISKGDELTVSSETYDNNYKWYFCINDSGKSGIVPADYVKILIETTANRYYNDPYNYINKPFYKQSKEQNPQSNNHAKQVSQIPTIEKAIEKSAPQFSEKCSMSIIDWITLFEMDMENIDSDSYKIRRLRFYLESEALLWYSQEIAEKRDTMTWEDCKQEMIIRFNSHQDRPIIEAIQRQFKNTDTIQKYYADKMTFLNQTNLSDLDKVAMLTNGMPSEIQFLLISANLITPLNWLSYCSKLAINYQKCKSLNKQIKEDNNELPKIVSISNFDKIEHDINKISILDDSQREFIQSNDRRSEILINKNFSYGCQHYIDNSSTSTEDLKFSSFYKHNAKLNDIDSNTSSTTKYSSKFNSTINSPLKTKHSLYNALNSKTSDNLTDYLKFNSYSTPSSKISSIHNYAINTSATHTNLSNASTKSKPISILPSYNDDNRNISTKPICTTKFNSNLISNTKFAIYNNIDNNNSTTTNYTKHKATSKTDSKLDTFCVNSSTTPSYSTKFDLRNQLKSYIYHKI